MTKDLTNLLDEPVISYNNLLTSVLHTSSNDDTDKMIDESLHALEAMDVEDRLVNTMDFIEALDKQIKKSYATLPEFFRTHIDFNDTEAKVLEAFEKVEIDYRTFVIVPNSTFKMLYESDSSIQCNNTIFVNRY